MEKIIEQLAQNGGTGLLAVVLLYQIVFFGKRVLNTIDNNTSALSKMAEIIRHCQKEKQDV